MAGFVGIGKVLIIAGLIILGLGLLLTFGGRLPFFGKLPGDIVIEREGFSFYFPLVTFLLLSLVLTGLVNLIFWLLGR